MFYWVTTTRSEEIARYNCQTHAMAPEPNAWGATWEWECKCNSLRVRWWTYRPWWQVCHVCSKMLSTVGSDWNPPSKWTDKAQVLWWDELSRVVDDDSEILTSSSREPEDPQHLSVHRYYLPRYLVPDISRCFPKYKPSCCEFPYPRQLERFDFSLSRILILRLCFVCRVCVCVMERE